MMAIPLLVCKPRVMPEEVTDTPLIARVMERYVAKYNAGKDFFDNFVAGKNQHRLYRFKPRLFVLFDEVNFDRSNYRHEWRPSPDRP